jgi:hypothetical protein
MTDLLTIMLSAIKNFSTDFLANESLATALEGSLFFPAEAFHLHIYIAFRTGTLVALILTFVS